MNVELPIVTRKVPGLAAAMGCALLLGACALRAPVEPQASQPPDTPADTTAAIAVRDAADPVHGLLVYHQATRALAPAALARERTAAAEHGPTPIALIQQALLASRPPGGNLARAVTLLETVLSSPDPEAVALHPLARLLVDQLLERHRLEGVNERLTQQLERTGQQLKDSQRQADQLKEKLEALAEIERTLPARPPAAPPPATPERRTPP